MGTHFTPLGLCDATRIVGLSFCTRLGSPQQVGDPSLAFLSLVSPRLVTPSLYVLTALAMRSRYPYRDRYHKVGFHFCIGSVGQLPGGKEGL